MVLTAVVAAAGGVVLLSRQSWLPGVALVAPAVAAILAVAGALLARPRAAVVDGHAWWDVEKWCRTILSAWPRAEGMIGLEDVTAVVESARWDLARLHAERGELVAARDEATFAQYGFDWDDPLRQQLGARREQVVQRLETLDQEIARRSGRLRSLAEHCAHLSYRPDSARRTSKRERRAYKALAQADSAMVGAAPWDVRTDPATDLAEQTAVVLTAYQELAAGHEENRPTAVDSPETPWVPGGRPQGR